MMVKFHNRWYKMDVVVPWNIMVERLSSHGIYVGKHIHAMAHEQQTIKQKKHAFVLSQAQVVIYFMKMNYLISKYKKRAKQ